MSGLIESMCRSGGITPDQARRMLADILTFLAARLPSPVLGRIKQALSEEDGNAGL